MASPNNMIEVEFRPLILVFMSMYREQLFKVQKFSMRGQIKGFIASIHINEDWVQCGDASEDYFISLEDAVDYIEDMIDRWFDLKITFIEQTQDIDG